jgi:hypothetical protein
MSALATDPSALITGFTTAMANAGLTLPDGFEVRKLAAQAEPVNVNLFLAGETTTPPAGSAEAKGT